MRIAQVAPLHESVPPQRYGGTERVVANLTEELVGMGHDVTVFASGDSTTSARIVPGCAVALRHAGCADAVAPHVAMIEDVYRRAHDFDVLHFHVDYLHFPASRREGRVHVSTMHGRLDLPELAPVYGAFDDLPLVSISDAQRAPLPDLAWQRTIHHGLRGDSLALGDGRGGYLAFLGRMSPEKGLDRAIEIAARAGMPLRVAAKLDRADRDYHDRVLRPLLAQPGVEYLGEIGDRDKQEFLGGARALLFPIAWPEPFGIVMIEAMACGTPVVAFARGSVREVVDHGVTGFVCETVDDAVRAVAAIDTVPRDGCRRRFEDRFTSRRMAADYIELYRRLADARRDHPDRGPVLHPRRKHAHG
ncbi:MAG: glycosyltransferase family 4 protein [Deltaproteobacteria bacterium]|nr:glycosyltransferase family 4 protein [Deltaproteobacteria bacterium]